MTRNGTLGDVPTGHEIEHKLAKDERC